MESIRFTETPKFKNPEEEIRFLRERLKEKERSLEHMPTTPERERLTEETIGEYQAREPEEVLEESYRAKEREVEKIVLELSPEEHDETMEELLGILQEQGLKNTLSVLEKMDNPHITDDFHRFLVQYIHHDPELSGLEPGSQIFKALHMKLYEIALPSAVSSENREKTFKEMIAVMEQFYAGMLSISDGKDNLPGRNNFTLEIANANIGNEVVFYVAVPAGKESLLEKHLHATFPHAKLSAVKDDYNVFNEDGASVGSLASSSENPIFPIKTYDQFEHDPLNSILNAFSKLENKGEGAALQIVISPAGDQFIKRYGLVLDKIRKGVPAKKAINTPETFTGGFTEAVGELFFASGAHKGKNDASANLPGIDEAITLGITQKISSTIFNTNIRIIASAETEHRAREILSDIESAFNQFGNTQGNGISFTEIKGRKLLRVFQEFSYRTFVDEESLPLNLKELTTILHFPVKETHAEGLRQAKAGSAPSPLDLPKEGTLLGVNKYHNVATEVYMKKEDRLRHFYTIGQTGTGKTTLLKNMIIQDIARGEGVCMIDPHGTDIVDVLANIPKERMRDVIYFDPSYTERPMGLNMLEYDTRYPEQKTFVVDELLSIFNKLFDMKVAGGPMFEQYFRNATLLVIDDPSSGNTLLDVSRVLSDAEFREFKLSRCKNPVVLQFWRDIAGKAGGESALANIVPYITSKFDVFLANEIMRPIIAQSTSAFNFRKVMDERKILLVNLSKGRLGDINAHLIGLILVGKILMAALSRVDAVGTGKLPDFYLYIDEFQNITTDSIATILSEARKYGLSLNLAHQFIAQLDDRTKDAVFGNVGSLAVFRVGAQDAEYVKSQFEPVFTPSDIMNLDNYNAYLKLLVNGQPAKPFSIETRSGAKGDPAVTESIKELSYSRYGRDRAEVEAEIMAKYRKSV